MGANLFVGNLGKDVDEKELWDIFKIFGIVMSTKIMWDENEKSKGYGFVSYDNFESADEAIKALNGQFVAGKAIEVTYAYKKDNYGEKHGSIAEWILNSNKAMFAPPPPPVNY